MSSWWAKFRAEREAAREANRAAQLRLEEAKARKPMVDEVTKAQRLSGETNNFVARLNMSVRKE